MAGSVLPACSKPRVDQPVMRYANLSNKIMKQLGPQAGPYVIVVSTENQTLSVFEKGCLKDHFVISTSKNGQGQEYGSFKTPLGLHRIREKIGEGVPPYGIFNQRRYVGATWKKTPRFFHKKDYISTRIFCLEGLENGFNRGFDRWGRVVDSKERAVYIHGTTMEWKLGRPFTKGCIHMGTKDVIRLYDYIPQGALVMII